MANRAGALALVGLLVVVTGCTKSEAGQAAPATDRPSSQPTTGSSSGSASPTVTIPPRPKVLRIDDVEPCDLFTQPQLDQLKLDRKRKVISNSERYKGMRDCSLDANAAPFDHYSALAVTSDGIDFWFTGNRNVESRLSSVAGYGAATYWFRGARGNDTPDCSTSVDVADGQQLMITADNDGKHSFTLEQLCQRAELAAGLAIQTLQTLR